MGQPILPVFADDVVFDTFGVPGSSGGAMGFPISPASVGMAKTRISTVVLMMFRIVVCLFKF